MGTDVHIILVGDDEATHDLADLAQARIDDLERRWSRFIADSELSQLNAAAGEGPQAVTAITFELIEAAADAWRRTVGVFDPTVLPSLLASGYDRSFDLINEERPAQPTMHTPVRAPGCEHIALDRERLTV